MTEYTIAVHRPPLKRIDFGPKMRATPPDPYAGYEVDRTAEIEEQQRIWRLVKQSVEGCNQVEATAEPSVYRDDTSLWQSMIDEAGR